MGNAKPGNARKQARRACFKSGQLAGETHSNRNGPETPLTTENRGVASSILALAIA